MNQTITKATVSVLLALVCLALFASSAQAVQIRAETGDALPSSIIVNENLTVLITDDAGAHINGVAESARVLYILPADGGDPIPVAVGSDGKTVNPYKPSMTGVLNITVLYGTTLMASQTVNVVLEVADTTNPTIRSVILDPATVNASETFLVTVNATDASGIANVTANATTGIVTLTSMGGDDWEGTLTAPSTAGVYTVTVVATDASPNTNKATDTSKQISVIPLPTEQEASYDVNDTPTEDGNNVTISGNGAITADNPLNDTVSIDLGDGKLVIEINVNSTDNTTGTVASVTLDTPAVTASGTTWEQNESADVDLNLNDSVWTGSNTPKLTIQPLNDIKDELSDDALDNATSAILELQGTTDTAMVMQATLSGIDESDVKSLPIEMTVDADWYNSQDKVYLFKFYENGTEKQRKPPNSVSHNETSGTYTLSFEMDGFSIFALVGTKTAALPSRRGGGGGGGGGTYPPGWFGTPSPTVTATAPSPGEREREHVTPAPTKAKPAASKAAAPAAGEAAAETAKKSAPGFTAVFAIAGMLALAYVMMRRRG